MKCCKHMVKRKLLCTSVLRGGFGEEERKQVKVNRSTCFGKLREGYEPYREEALDVILQNIRGEEFHKAKGILDREGISVTLAAKQKRDLGFLASNMTHGFVEPVGKVAVTGICFPEKPTLQSVFPLLAIKDLFESKSIETAYVAVPLFAYVGAGLARYRQYLETLAIMNKLYSGQMGERVFLIPDHREEVMGMKYKISNLTSRFVSDEPAKEKYPFNNLFGYFETGAYGADIVLAGISEQQDTTTVCDFRQFESIHAGIKMSKRLNVRSGALLYTLINPSRVDGKIREVSQDNEGEQESAFSSIAEVSSDFYHAALLFSKEEVFELYDQYRKGRVDVYSLRERLRIEKRKLFDSPSVSSSFVSDIEEKSIQKISTGSELLNDEIAKRLRINEIDMRKGVVYEFK